MAWLPAAPQAAVLRRRNGLIQAAVIFGSLLLLGGCSPSGVVIAPSQTQSTVLVAPAPWVPSSPIVVPAQLSDAELMAGRDADLKSVAEGFNVPNPPKVALVRWTTRLDWGSTMAQCLQDAGFNVVGAGFGITAPQGIGQAQLSAYNLAYYTCNAEYTMNPQYEQDYTASQWGLTYDYYVEWLVPCVALFGVTASQPPTRQTFIAQGLHQKYTTWDPWSEADQVMSNKPWSQQKVFMDMCPADPPTQYMWGA